MGDIEKEAVNIVAKLICLAVRTAPKTGGADFIYADIVNEATKKAIVEKMKEIGIAKKNNLLHKNPKRGAATEKDWFSDADAVNKSDALILIGVRGRKVPNINCGVCGFENCADMVRAEPFTVGKKDFPGPFCMFRVMDLSIAFGSATKVAADHNVDNRMMQKVGVAALKLGLLDPCDLIMGLPLSASGKNIYFDRIGKVEAWKILGRGAE